MAIQDEFVCSIQHTPWNSNVFLDTTKTFTAASLNKKQNTCLNKMYFVDITVINKG